MGLRPHFYTWNIMIEIIVVGSHAANRRIEGFREIKKDLDLVCTWDNFLDYRKNLQQKIYYPISGKNWIVKGHAKDLITEVEIAWGGSSGEQLIELVKNDPNTIILFDHEHNINFYYPSINVLYLLKMSHRYLKDAPSFNKTMDDIWKFRYHDAIIEQNHMDFYNFRMKETYSYSHPSLKRNKKEFFSGDGVTYIYEHDTIHESMKLFDRPAYEYFKDDLHEVFCSRKKFFECDLDIRIAAVVEESLVLALERSQVPFPNTDPRKSFITALKKVCSSITSGWFREYAWEHYH